MLKDFCMAFRRKKVSLHNLLDLCKSLYLSIVWNGCVIYLNIQATKPYIYLNLFVCLSLCQNYNVDPSMETNFNVREKGSKGIWKLFKMVLGDFVLAGYIPENDGFIKIHFRKFFVVRQTNNHTYHNIMHVTYL